jgi:hypothetical protein
MKTLSVAVVILFALFCSGVSGQVPQKKGDLTVSDREEWREVLKWPDECEEGFRAYNKYFPTGGMMFSNLGDRDYLVSIGCAGRVALFMYYRDDGSASRLLKFPEYDRAHHSAASSYSTVNFLSWSFESDRGEFHILSRGRGKTTCLIHNYKFLRGTPVFLSTKTIRCAAVI